MEVVHWNPRRSLLPGYLPRTTRINNFGDLLGPFIVGRLVPQSGEPNPEARRLLSVGSILQFARDGDVVWGTGVNGKMPEESLRATRLDVRAVRGPLTAEVLRRRGIEVPDVFGDPGLLAPNLLGVRRAEEPTIRLTSIPNLNEYRAWAGRPGLVNPRSRFRKVIEAIARSELVIASSLHAIVVADVLGVPVVPVLPAHEAIFKYQDYYEGTARALPRLSRTYDEAMLASPAPALVWSSAALVDAFPADLWATAARSAS